MISKWNLVIVQLLAMVAGRQTSSLEKRKKKHFNFFQTTKKQVYIVTIMNFTSEVLHNNDATHFRIFSTRCIMPTFT